MKLVSDDCNVEVINPSDNLDETKLPDGISFYAQRNYVLKAVKNSLYGFVTGCKDHAKFYDSMFGKQPYDPNKVYKIHTNTDKYPYPLQQLQETMIYFQTIYKKFGTEACVLLMFNFKTKKWHTLRVLQLDAAPGHVEYIYPSNEPAKDNPKTNKVFEDENLKKLQLRVWDQYKKLYDEGYRIVGTIHSHCDMDAFHSGVDDDDEFSFDGLHITIGRVTKGWSFSQRWILGTAIFDTHITDIVQTKYKNIIKIPNNITITDEDLELLIVDKPIVQPSYNLGDKNYPFFEDHDFFGGDSIPSAFDWDKKNFDDPSKDLDSLSISPQDRALILEEKDSIRLIHTVTGNVILVNKKYFLSNQRQFDFYKVSPISTVKDKVCLLNVPSLNPSYPNGEPSKQIIVSRKG